MEPDDSPCSHNLSSNSNASHEQQLNQTFKILALSFAGGPRTMLEAACRPPHQYSASLPRPRCKSL